MIAGKLDGFMGTAVRYVEEVPNMNYVLELSGADFDFKCKFIATIKQEFSSQLGTYLYHIKKDEPRAAAEVVHEIKFKFGILGMKHAFDFSEYHQERLQVGDMALDEDFKRYLRQVNRFLMTTGYN